MGKNRWDIIGVGVAVFGLALGFITWGANVDQSLALGIGAVLLVVGLAITLIGTTVPRRMSTAYWRWRHPTGLAVHLRDAWSSLKWLGPQRHYETHHRDPEKEQRQSPSRDA